MWTTADWHVAELLCWIALTCVVVVNKEKVKLLYKQVMNDETVKQLSLIKHVVSGDVMIVEHWTLTLEAQTLNDGTSCWHSSFTHICWMSSVLLLIQKSFRSDSQIVVVTFTWSDSSVDSDMRATCYISTTWT